MPEVPRISAMLSDDARRGWETFCDAHGITLSGLLEAAGRIMDERGSLTVDAVVWRAREVDRERAQRP